ncbi:MAG: CDC48 family AAA ATPase [bacterium]
MEQTRQLTLQVGGAQSRDVGKGTARVPMEVFQELGIQEGSIVEITGKRSTAAVALRPYDEDAGLRVIRLDGLQRANANAGIGESVGVARADVSPARRVVIAPAQPNVQLSGSGRSLIRTILHRPLVSGDVISTSVYRRGPDGAAPLGMPDSMFQELFGQRSFGLAEMRLLVVGTTPKGIVQITNETQVDLRPRYQEPEESRKIDVTYDDVGGIGQAIDQVREMIELPLKHPELFQRLGIDPPKGVLLQGPPGTGKTLLARAVANESDAGFFVINGPEIMGKHYGESEERLRSVFQEAQNDAPSIIFVDEIDSIAPKREETTGEVERRVVAQLLTLMDGLQPRQNVVVIGATNRVDALDEALRRPGRFDREIVIGVPDLHGRREILQIHTRGMPIADDVSVEEIARRSHGYVGADISALAREAAIEALRRNLPDIDLDAEEIPGEVLERLQVTHDDFVRAFRRVQPSALREILVQIPDVTWDDVGGLESVKQQLREGIELPLKNAEAYQRLGIRPAKGFLLYGPPGTGKTMLAKAVAHEAEANFISAKSSSLLSKWYGESERQVTKLFERARQVSPSIILIDEIDSMAPQRGAGFGDAAVTERVVNTLLAEIDGLEELEGVVVIGVTNRPNLLDHALLRPGRFDELIYVPVPDRDARRTILQIQVKEMPLAADVDLDSIANRTERYSGADIENLVRKAGLEALRTNVDAKEVTMTFFEAALADSHPSITPEMEEDYRKISARLKQERPTSGRIGFAVGE